MARCNGECWDCPYEGCIDEAYLEELMGLDPDPGDQSYYQRHKEKCRERSRKYYKEHREKMREYFKDYYQKNKEKENLRTRTRNRQRYAEDPEFREREKARARMNYLKRKEKR